MFNKTINDINLEDTRILTKELVEDILKKEELGIPIKKTEKLWFDNQQGVRKSGLKYAMSDEELQEYIKCKQSVNYFAEKYCKIKLEDGSIGPMKLRDYQKKIIDLYTNNRFSILCASRQCGKCVSPITKLNILNIKTNVIVEISFYKLYFNIIKKERKLTLLEKIKYILYNIYEFLDKYQ